MFVYTEISHLKLWHAAFRNFIIPALYYLSHSPYSDWRSQRTCR